ncbi:GbsR/MarR family transcriptional regulator [Virgibacillus siamensis]|uniref:GbsR/MarR family transcriptional regulator n=1 Tax=Virgibacillus siamensis TaxID=480071 RepID=UPI00098496AA|nr:helix-turn-helix domain-containing protein [Virgibacillus siamensis]
MLESNTEDLTKKIITEFSKTIEMFGFSTLEARLFVYLYLEQAPMTLDEMSEAMGKSKTSMSTSIRSLSDFNLVTRVWKKGVRKDLYEANEQIFKTFMNSYLSRWIDAANHQKDSLNNIKEQFENANIPSSSLNNRLLNIIEFHQQLEKSLREIKQI